MKKYGINYKYLFIFLLFSSSLYSYGEELIIDEKDFGNFNFVFEAAPKDKVFSQGNLKNLRESETDIHIEALVTWRDNINIEGQIPNSHIPYLDIKAEIINEKTNESVRIDLIPHINLTDGYHYARNIKLPGSAMDPFTVNFSIKSKKDSLTYHNDWKSKYGLPVMIDKDFSYNNLDFYEMSKKFR